MVACLNVTTHDFPPTKTHRMQQVASTSVYFGRRTIVWLSNTPLGRVYTPSRVISTEARSNFRRRLATEEDDYQVS